MVFEDKTETRRRRDAAKDILLGETRHRGEEFSAVVQALATQTEVEGRSGEEYRDAFLGRFEESSIVLCMRESMGTEHGRDNDQCGGCPPGAARTIEAADRTKDVD